MRFRGRWGIEDPAQLLGASSTQALGHFGERVALEVNRAALPARLRQPVGRLYGSVFGPDTEAGRRLAFKRLALNGMCPGQDPACILARSLLHGR
jgi:hypothetical protein